MRRDSRKRPVCSPMVALAAGHRMPATLSQTPLRFASLVVGLGSKLSAWLLWCCTSSCRGLRSGSWFCVSHADAGHDTAAVIPGRCHGPSVLVLVMVIVFMPLLRASPCVIVLHKTHVQDSEKRYTCLTDIHQRCCERHATLEPQVRCPPFLPSLLLLLLLLGEARFRRLLLFVGRCIRQPDQLLRSPETTKMKQRVLEQDRPGLPKHVKKKLGHIKQDYSSVS